MRSAWSRRPVDSFEYLGDQAGSVVAVGCEGNAVDPWKRVETRLDHLLLSSYPQFEMFGAAPTAELTVASIFGTLMGCTLDHFYELRSIAGTMVGGQSSCWSAKLGIRRYSLGRLPEKPVARTP